MFKDRLKLIEKIEAERKSRVLLFVTGDRPGLETQIHTEVLDFFSDHLDTFDLPKKISLVIYSRGGDTLAGWNIVNLIKLFCDEFEVIVPSKARSTATLVCLGASTILMTKQATLGPIDPSINTPLNPQIPGAPAQQRLPISVEAVAGYFDLARKELATSRSSKLADVFTKLVDNMHPIALGNVYRARTQIQRLAEKLLNGHMLDKGKVKKIISVLCSESGSHDYTINRREALHDLGLPIEKPSESFYQVIKELYDDIRDEMELNRRFDPNIELGGSSEVDYSVVRGCIESLTGGSHKFYTKGKLTRTQVPTPNGVVNGIQNEPLFEGWEHEYEQRNS
jgi:hypothetical protein